MKRFVAKLGVVNADAKGIDQAVRSATNGKFWSYKALLNSFLANWKKSVVTNRWSVEKFVTTYCGMNFKNNDTGSITGLDAGGKVVKTKSSVVPNILPVDKWKLPASQKTVIEGCTFIWPNMKNLTNKEKYLLKGLHSSWIQGALRLIKQSFGIGFGTEQSSCNTITIKFVKDVPTRSAWTSTNWLGNRVSKITLYINKNVDFDMKSVDGVVKGNWVGDNRTDRNLAHELTHACLASNTLGSYDLPLALNEGIAELVHGGDDTRKDYITSILSKSNIDKFKKTMAVDSHEFWQEGLYGGSLALLRYMVKQGLADVYRYTNAKKTAMALTSSFSGTYKMASWKGVMQVDARENKKVITIKGTASANTIYANKKTSTISALSGNDTIVVSAGTAHKVSAGAGNDVIKVSAGTKSVLSGGDGKDKFTVSGGSENKFYGNDGNDTIIVSKGTKCVVSGGAGSDIIEVKSGSHNKYHGGDNSDTFIIKGGTNDVYYAGNGNNRFEIVSSSFKGTSVVRLAEDTKDAVNTFVFDKAITDYAFSMVGKNLSVVGSDEKITIFDWEEHTTSRMIFAGDVRYSFSAINKRIEVV